MFDTDVITGTSRRKKLVLFLGVSLGMALSALSAHAQITEVLRVGDAAPIGGAYRGFERSESAGGGRAVFIARTTDGISGIFGAAAPPGSVVTFRGEATPNGEVRRFSRPAANVFGEHAWQARTTTTTGIFADVAAQNVVALKGRVVGAATMQNFERPVITDAGDVVFFALLSTSQGGIFRCTGGNGNCNSGTATLQQMVTIGHTYFDSVDGTMRVICSLGEQLDASAWGIAFRARTALVGAGCSGTRVETVLRKQYGGAYQAVVKAGDEALPGASREHFRFDGPPVIDNDGDIAILGETVNPVDDVIYFCDLGSCPGTPLQPIVVQRDTDVDGNVLTRFKAIGMSDVDDIVFQTVVELAIGGKTSGIYLATSPAVRQKIITNHETNGPFEFRRIGKPSMSSDGYVSFESLVTDGITSQFAVFVYN